LWWGEKVQFKPVGNRIQLVAYRGYDQEKRRAIVKVLGSIDAYSLDVPQTLLEVLSDEEKAEVESYIADTRAKNQKRNNALSIQYIASNLDRVADLVLGGGDDYELSEQWGVEMWAALEKMQKSLRKAGFKRPVRQPNPKPVKQQQAGFELNQQWAEEALVALDAVQQTLKKAGFKLPVKRAKSKPVNQQQAGLDLD